MKTVRAPLTALIALVVAIGLTPAGAGAQTPEPRGSQGGDPFSAAVEQAGQPAAVPNESVELPTEATRPLTARLGESEVTVGLPATGRAETTDVTRVFEADGPDAQIATEPLSDGVRALVKIDSAAADERYAFDLGGDVAALESSPAGGVILLDAHDEPIGAVDAPWARDADGVPVETHYEVDDRQLVQVVTHRRQDVAYPVVADPSIRICNLVFWCVKFTRTETRSIANQSFSSLAVFAASLCSRVRHPIIGAGCAAGVVAAGGAMRGTFRNARDARRCVQIRFTSGGVPVRWAGVRC